ncbi:MAG: thiamine phosphate synthase, partial [Actinomycetota bacterium]
AAAEAGGLSGPPLHQRVIEVVKFVTSESHLPVVGVGGIDPSNTGTVLATGAAGVAVVSAVGTASDPVAATRRLVEAVHAAASVPRG